MAHNPEFLTARTAYEDFHNQKHVVLGSGLNTTNEDMKCVKDLYENIIQKHQLVCVPVGK